MEHESECMGQWEATHPDSKFVQSVGVVAFSMLFVSYREHSRLSQGICPKAE